MMARMLVRAQSETYTLKELRQPRSARHVCPFVNLVGPGPDRGHRPNDGHGSGAEPGLHAGRQKGQHRQGKRGEKARLTVCLDPIVLDHLPRIDVVLPKGTDEERTEDRCARVSEPVAGPVNDSAQQIDRRHAEGEGYQHGEPPSLGHEASEAHAQPNRQDDRSEDRGGQDHAAGSLYHAWCNSRVGPTQTP